MALFMKQDFSPPLLSRRWIAIKCRPNMVLYCRKHIISILESGLLFREDSIEVEQEAPAPEEVWNAAKGLRGGWLTKGEGIAAAVGITTCMLAFPPKSFHRSSLVNLAAYLSIPVAVRVTHRLRSAGSLTALLSAMREYLALARRAAACLKEYAALHAQLGSLSSVIESTHTLLCRQQSELSILMSRASSALLGNAPWLRADVAWDAVRRDPDDNLMKIHHAFLVVQSTLLKHIAMFHYIPPAHVQRLYKNHNERIYWVHTAVLPLLTEEFKQNYDALQRMYRLLKNSANKDTDSTKKLGAAFNNNWLYSDVHTGVAKTCLELKLVLNKCNSLDVFLDSCALNEQEIDLNILNRDIDNIIDNLTKCLDTVQSSQLRLRKLQHKQSKETNVDEKEIVVDNAEVLTVEVTEPESKDEVFYFLKTDDDDNGIPLAEDLTTAPGKKEKETTRIVLTELRRKLGKREDVMRERERQALAKTMPDLKEIPDFPRQINFDDFVEKKGYIKKLKRKSVKKSLLRIKFKRRKLKTKSFRLCFAKYSHESDIKGDIYEANAKFNLKSKLLTVSRDNKYIITKWCKREQLDKNDLDSSGLSDGLSDVEVGTANKTVNETTNKGIRFTKKELELSPSSSESEFEFYNENQLALLNDVRRNRVVRKKNHPVHRRATDNVDESMKPIEYTFGTGMAMASVLQINKRFPIMAQEEVFIGDGEVSNDSGNDEDV